MTYETEALPAQDGNTEIEANTPPAGPTKAQELETAARQTLARLGGGNGAPIVNIGTRYKVSMFDIPVALADGSALLLNSRTRSLILLSPNEARTYRGMVASGTFPANQPYDRMLMQTLVRAGHLLGANADELAWVREDHQNRRSNQESLNLTIAPTMACNFGCGYCYQGTDKPTTKMAPEVEDAIIAFIKGKANLKSLNIVWYGGEPLMGKDAIFRISDRLIAYCDKKNITFTAGMVSNSYLLTAELAQQLYSRRIKWVQVTIDGDRDIHDKMRPLTSGHGTFDKIIENIGATLDATPISFNVRVNVGRTNIEGVSAMLDGLAEQKFAKRGSFGVYFAPIEAATAESGTAFEERLSRVDFGKAVLDIEAKARRLGLASTISVPNGFSGMCVAAVVGGYVIAGNGDVHKCWDTAHDPLKRTGNILAPDQMNATVAANLWQDWTPFDSAICSSCKILPLCGGHCAHRFVYGGPEHAALPCPSWKWNTAEYIFSRAVDLGIVQADKWMPEQATVLANQSGPVQTQESLQMAQQVLLDKLSAKHNRQFDHDMLLAGEPVLEHPASPANFRQEEAS